MNHKSISCLIVLCLATALTPQAQADPLPQLDDGCYDWISSEWMPMPNPDGGPSALVSSMSRDLSSFIFKNEEDTETTVEVCKTATSACQVEVQGEVKTEKKKVWLGPFYTKAVVTTSDSRTTTITCTGTLSVIITHSGGVGIRHAASTLYDASGVIAGQTAGDPEEAMDLVLSDRSGCSYQAIDPSGVLGPTSCETTHTKKWKGSETFPGARIVGSVELCADYSAVNSLNVPVANIVLLSGQHEGSVCHVTIPDETLDELSNFFGF